MPKKTKKELNIQEEIKDEKMKMKLIPFKKVGNFELGKSIDLYKEKYKLLLFDDSLFEKDTTHLKTYNLIKPDTALNVEETDFTIRSIMCDEELYYKGANLIGMTIEKFIAHTGEKNLEIFLILDYEEDGIPRNVYISEMLGLEIWEKGSGGKITTIIVEQKYEEEEEDE